MPRPDQRTPATPVPLLVVALVLLVSCVRPAAPQTGLPASGSATLSGVVAADGVPLPDAVVTVVVPGGPVGFEVVATVTTDAEGRYHASDLPPGPVFVSAASPDREPALLCGKVLDADVMTTAADLELGPSDVGIHGRVVLADGDPVPGGRLVATPFAPSTGPSPCGVITALAAPDGTFEVGVTPGLHAIFGRAPGYVDDIDVVPLEAPYTRVFTLDPAAAPGPAPDAVVDWVRANKIDLATVQPGQPLDDLAGFGAIVGDAGIVALGEATHGSREFFQLKHRLLEYLVTEKGFTAFAIEAAMPEAFAIDHYIQTGEGDPAALLAGLHFWTWDVVEILALIEWMRQWNLDHGGGLRFYGFDAQDAGLGLSVVSEWLAAHGHTPDLGGLIPLRQAWTSRDLRSRSVELLPAATEAAIDLLRYLDDHHEDLVEASSEGEFARIRQHAVVVQQHIAMLGPASREEVMADNIAWIAERESGVVVWAHNSHVSAHGFGGRSMGEFLRIRYREGLRVIGLEFGSGGFQAIPFPFWRRLGVQELSVDALDDESLPAMLSRAGDSPFVLDLNAIPAESEADTWFAARRNAHSIGAGFPPGTPGYGPAAQLAERQYDALAFVPTVTAATPNPHGVNRPSVHPHTPSRVVHSVDGMDFDDSERSAPPRGWQWLPRNEAFGYRAEVVDCPFGGCAELRRDPADAIGHTHASITKRIPLEPTLAGQKIRLSGQVRSDGPAWLRARIEADEAGRFALLDTETSSMGDSPEWAPTMVELRIPEGAGFLVLEFAFEGTGSAALGDMTLTVLVGAPVLQE